MSAITLGELLKQKRLAKGLTFQAVADATGSCKGYIHELEAGKSKPSLLMAAKLSLALDMPIGVLATVALIGDIKGTP